MKQKRHIPLEISAKLESASRLRNDGTSIGSICQSLNISRATYYRWKQRFGKMTCDQIEQQLQWNQEINRLRKQVDASTTEVHILRTALFDNLLSPARRKEAVSAVRELIPVSERLACRALGQSRATQRYQPQPTEQETRLVQRMTALSHKYPRYGYRQIHAMLCREGWRVNRKRIHRLWRRESLQVTLRRKPKRYARTTRRQEHEILKTTAINQVWAWDMISDRTTGGKPLRWITMIDEYTRECLAVEVMHRVTASAVIEALSGVLQSRKPPQYLRCDNTRPFVLDELRRWLVMANITTIHIMPGCPWENPFIESFHARMRDGFLNCESFAKLDEARRCTARWRRHYNHVRAHSSLDYLTPNAFAKTCL